MSDHNGDGTYLLGVAVADVTPPVGGRLTGYGDRTEPSIGIYQRLSATAMALTDSGGGATVVLLSAEWLGFYDRIDEVRPLIMAATGLPESHVVLVGTHTHCGPAIRHPIPGSYREPTDEGFLAEAFQTLAETAVRALADREPVTLRTTMEWCGFARSRRQPDGRGGVNWAPTLDAPHDHTVPVLTAHTVSGRLKHVMFGYACHATARGGLEIGGDWPGFAMAEIRARHGCSVAFYPGCAGDQRVGVPSGDPSVFRTCTLEEVKAFGRQAAAAVDRALSRGQGAVVRGALRVAQRKFPLRTRVLARAEYEASLSSPHVYEQRWAQDHLAYLDRGEVPPGEMVFECQTLVIGRSLAWVTWAGEMTVEHGLRLGRRWGGTFDCVWPLAYANGMVGYVAVDRQLPEGGYEVITCMINHGRSGPLEPGTEGRIHTETDAMLAAAAQAGSSG